MRYSKHGVGLFGLLAVVGLAVMAFASSAQALTPKFLVGKKAVVAGLNAVVEGRQIGRGILLVPSLNTAFNCEKFTVNKGLLESGTKATGELTYEECTVLELKSPFEEIPCTIKNNKKIVETGVVLPAELTSGAPAVLVESINALIGLESGTGCPLPLDNIIKGELCLKIEGNDTVNPRGVSSEAIQKECKERVTLEGTEGVGSRDKVLYGAQEAFTDVTVELFLGGAAHKGLTLGVSLQ